MREAKVNGTRIRATFFCPESPKVNGTAAAATFYEQSWPEPDPDQNLKNQKHEKATALQSQHTFWQHGV